MVSIFAESFFIVLLAEMGDKSQLLMVAMTAEYRLREIIIGVVSAILVLNGLAIAVGAVLGDLLPGAVISVIAGMAFLSFAFCGLFDGDDGEEKVEKKSRHAMFAVFGTYFLAELGDKTQLTALTLAAGGGGIRAVLGVFFGASLALFLSDLLGLLVGFLLGKKLPTSVFRIISFILFFLCGIAKLSEGFDLLFIATPHPVLFSVLATLGGIATTVGMFGTITMIRKKKEREWNDTGAKQSVPKQRFQ